METDPERPIEKLLRAAARKRGQEAGGSFSLHPATRKLLQGEVARTLGRKTPETHSAHRAMWKLWPRLALASAAIVAMGLGVWLLLPAHPTGSQPQLLAQNEPAKKPDLAESISPPPASPAASLVKSKSEARDQLKQLPAETPAIVVARAGSFSDSNSALADKDASADFMKKTTGNAIAETGLTVVAQTPVPASAGGATPARDGTPSPAEHQAAATHSLTVANQSVLRANNLSPAAPAATATGSASLNAVALENKPAPGAAAEQMNRARFVRAETPLKEKASDTAPASSVLSSFQVEQSGQQIRVTDEDGSIYSGQLQPLNHGAGLLAGTATDARVLSAPKTMERRYSLTPRSNSVADALGVPDYYYFRVEGTNMSLNQRVTFTGNFLATTNLAGAEASNTAVKLLQSTNNLAPLLNSRIQGKVKLGNQPEFNLNATPSK